MKCTGEINTDTPQDNSVNKPDVKRRKAVFSCDRCKARKRKCIRYITTENNEKIPTFDIIYPCQECIQSNSFCYTYIGQRKHSTMKKLSIPENLVADESVKQDPYTKIKELEMKCQHLSNLLKQKQLSPDIDAELFKEDEILQKSSAPSSTDATSNNDKNDSALENMEITSVDSDSLKGLNDLNENNRIRSINTTNLHDTVIDLIGSPDSLKSATTDFGHSTGSETLFNSRDLKMRCYDNNQLVYTIPREEADSYVCVYFDRIHPLCNCIDINEFVRSYELFWLILQHEDMRSINSVLFLSSPQICTIYLIWILGKKFINAYDTTLIDSYSPIIKNTLSEILINSSEAGIQMQILFSFYLEATQSRESAWIMVETAVTQAITIGMNKSGVNLTIRNDVDNKKQTSFKIWCTLFAQEVRLSSIIGRQSSVDFADLDIETPKFKNSTNATNLPKYWFHKINCEVYQAYFDCYYCLNKIFHEFLSYRSSVMEGLTIYTVPSIKKAWELRKKYHDWIHAIPPKLKDIFDQESPVVANYKVYLHLTYHYYFINLGLPFLMLILRIMQSDRQVKLKNSDPVYILAISAINCSKQIYNIIKYEFDNGIFNGSVYNDIYMLYHSTLIFTMALFVVSHEKVNSTLDIKHLETKGNISKGQIWSIICKVGELNKKLQPLTSGSNLEISKTIDYLVENVSHFLDNHKQVNEGDCEKATSNDKNKSETEDNSSMINTPNSKSFSNKLNNLFNTADLNTDELWKFINRNYNTFESDNSLFQDLSELDNYFID